MKTGDWCKYYELKVDYSKANKPEGFMLTMKMCRVVKVCAVMCKVRVLITEWNTNAVHLGHVVMIRKTELTVIK